MAPRILTSALDGCEWPASCPGQFTPRERAPGTLRIGGWVGPRAGLNVVARSQPEAQCYTTEVVYQNWGALCEVGVNIRRAEAKT
jgi:hypothetical protein